MSSAPRGRRPTSSNAGSIPLSLCRSPLRGCRPRCSSRPESSAGTGGLAGALLGEAGQLHPISVAAYRLLVGGAVRGRRRRDHRAAAAPAGAPGPAARVRRAARRVPGRLPGRHRRDLRQPRHADHHRQRAGVRRRGHRPARAPAARWPHDRRDRRLGRRTRRCCVAARPARRRTRSPASAWRCWPAAGSPRSRWSPSGRSPGRARSPRPGLLVGGVLLVPFGLAYGMAVPLTGARGRPGRLPRRGADGHRVCGAYFLGVRHAGATAAALATVLEPLTATLLSVGFHGERLTGASVAARR